MVICCRSSGLTRARAEAESPLLVLEGPSPLESVVPVGCAALTGSGSGIGAGLGTLLARFEGCMLNLFDDEDEEEARSPNSAAIGLSVVLFFVEGVDELAEAGNAGRARMNGSDDFRGSIEV